MATELTWLGHSAFRLDTPGSNVFGDMSLIGRDSDALRELVPPGVEILAPEPGEPLTF